VATKRGWRRLLVLLTTLYAVVGGATAVLVYVLVRYSEGHAVTDGPRNWALFTIAIYTVVYVVAWAVLLGVRWVIRGFRAPD
jgi:hypothetical protein